MRYLNLNFVFLGALLSVSSSLYIKEETKPHNLRIINGTEVPISKMPYMASVECYKNFVMSAVIVDQQYLLTYGFNLPPHTEGCIIKTGTADTINGNNYEISNGFVLGNSFTEMKFSLGAVSLESELQLNNSTQIIKVAKTPPPKNAEVEVAGWGFTSDSGPLPKTLRARKVNLLDIESCAKNCGVLTTGMLCSDGVISYGDFGGPVVYNGELVGIAIEPLVFLNTTKSFYVSMSDRAVQEFIAAVIGK